MANSKNSNSAGKIVGAAGAIAGTAGVIMKVVECVPKIVDIAQPVIEPLIPKDKGNRVIVPSLYKKEFLLQLDEATELLTNYGLKVLPRKIQVSDASPKYRNCFDRQVIDSEPKQGKKVAPGATVIVKYITQDVIDASQLIFEGNQQHKAEVKQLKAEKRSVRIEQTKTVAVDTAKKAKDGLLKVMPHKKKVDQCEDLSDSDVNSSSSDATS